MCARLGGWPRQTREGFSAENLWSDLHVGEIALHHIPHVRSKPQAGVPVTSLKLLWQGPRCANPVVRVKVMSFLIFLLHLMVAHPIPPESLHPQLP